MRHLQVKHRDIWQLKLEEQERRRKKKSPTDSQQQILSFGITSKYSSSHPKQKMVTKQFSRSFATNSTPRRLIENADFRAVLVELDPKYDPPSTYLLRKEQESFEGMKSNITTSLHRATKISLTADIWTKRGGSESFLGVTCHWFDRRTHVPKSATLAVRKITGRHTASLVYENICNILDAWNISKSKIFKVVTDNGSNMVAAFQESFQMAMMADEVELGSSDGEDDMEDDDNIAAMAVSSSLWGLEPEDDDDLIEKEIFEYNQEEEQMNNELASMRRIPCFAHSLQCAIRNLDESKFACGSRKKALELMNAFAHSQVATQKLIELKNRKLLTACRTRWSYNCLAFRRMIQLKDAIQTAVDHAETVDNNMTKSDWKILERYVKFTQPFADTTYSIEGNNYVTLSKVMPRIMYLQSHLEQMSEEPGYFLASTELMDEMKRRFKFIIDPTNGEPIYVVATALDPRYRLLLDDQQMAAAKLKILELIGFRSQSRPDQNKVPLSGSCPTSFQEDDDESQFISAIIQQRQNIREVVRSNPAVDEVEIYFKENFMSSPSDDPFDFWKVHADRFPILSSLAQDVLVIPATSAPVERVFSQAGIASGGKRYRLSGKRLEKEVMLKMNKSFC